MDDILCGHDPLVEKRLRSITASKNNPFTKNLFVVSPAFYLPSSIIFNALYWEEDKGAYKDIFVEISRRQTGLPLVKDAFCRVNGIKGMPSLNFLMTANNIVFGLAYTFPEGALPYELFFYYHKDKRVVFLEALKEMIISVHGRNFLLPTNWRSENGLLYSGRNGSPIFVTYNGVRPYDNKDGLLLGFLQDWRALKFMIGQLEKSCEQCELDDLLWLKGEVDSIIGRLKK
jgi:hypothetical protein